MDGALRPAEDFLSHPRWCFLKPERMRWTGFDALPVCTARCDPPSLSGAPYREYRALLPIDGKPKWHLVTRQYSCGFPLYFAHRIIIVASGIAEKSVA